MAIGAEMRRLIYGLSVGFFLLCGAAQARDEFDHAQCGHDIATALRGQKASNEPVAKTEMRHRDLSLKNLGGEEISDTLNSASWLICGGEYQLLSDRQGIILDPFGGAGTTLIAAEKSGRRARLIEIDPRYVDITVKRWQALTGGIALNAATDAPFARHLAKRL